MGLPTSFLAIFLTGWVFFHREIFLDPHWMLPRDNYYHFFLMFDFVSRYLQSTGGFPNWDYAAKLGMWLEPLANNYLLFAPYRLVGYLMVAVLNVSPAFAYKFCFLFVGQGIFLWAIYRLCRRFFESPWVAVLAVVLLVSGGFGVALLHSEMGFASVFYLPLLWLCALTLKEKPHRFPLFASLLGLSLNVHYPQLVVGYLAAVLMVGLVFSNALRDDLKSLVDSLFQRRFRLRIVITVAAFFISISPLLYSYRTYASQLGSNYRQQQVLQMISYDEYLKINEITYASLAPENLLLFLGLRNPIKPMGDLDSQLLFASLAVPIALVGAVLLKIPHQGFQFAMIFALAGLSIGVYGFVPRLLWNVMPGIHLFRQWYHFAVMLNVHLVLLVLFVGSRMGLKTRTVYFVLAVMSCVIWSRVEMADVKRFSVYDASLSKGNSAFINRHLNVANPKAIDLNRLFERYGTGSLFWVEGNQITPVTEFEARLDRRGYHLNISKGYEGKDALVWLQYNDQNWKISDGANPISPLRSEVLTLPVENRPVQATFRRPKTLWDTLIFLMWVPLLASVICPSLLREARDLRAVRFRFLGERLRFRFRS